MLGYRYLGRSGLKVSELGLGSTLTFYEEDSPGERHRIFDRFAERGGNLIDTADVYMRGRSEELIGAWLATRRRSDFIIVTKVGFSPDAPTAGAPVGDTHPNDEGHSRHHLIHAAEASLRRLRTGHIDLYLLHGFDPGTPFEETLRALEHLVDSGKVRYFGVSNHCGWMLQKWADLCRLSGAPPIVACSPLYNLLDRSTEWEILPVCRIEGIGVLPWSPLRNGWLGGRVRRGADAPPKDSKIEHAGEAHWARYAHERTWKILDALEAAARELGRTPAQIALRWLLQQPGVTAPILGARTLPQLEDALGASGWVLDGAIADRLSGVGGEERPYPYDLIFRTLAYR